MPCSCPNRRRAALLRAPNRHCEDDACRFPFLEASFGTTRSHHLGGLSQSEMESHPFALNVHACEVSCRAGTIKCSQCCASLAPVPDFGSPAERTRARPFGRQILVGTIESAGKLVKPWHSTIQPFNHG